MNHNQNKVVILGAYGTFGAIITTALCKQGFNVIASGRNMQKLMSLIKKIRKETPSEYRLDFIKIDVEGKDFFSVLKSTNASLVINTCGPFQKRDYCVAQSCIELGMHYIDLADARSFVTNIRTLDSQAKQKNVVVISGASTVPALSSSVINAYKDQFDTISSIQYGITPGQRSPRGLATTRSILSYLGKYIKPSNHYGWQNLHTTHYPTIGYRMMSACDIPDLHLFPDHYNIPKIEFSAGMESKCLHFLIWLTSWGVRFKLIRRIDRHAKALLKFSHLFDCFGSNDGGMHMIFIGQKSGGRKEIQWFIEAYDGAGINIPCAPAILLANKILRQNQVPAGAAPCMDMISLGEYVNSLSSFNIKTFVRAYPKSEP